MGPLTTADSAPVTRGAVPTPGPRCRSRAGREGLTGPIPRPPTASPARPPCPRSRIMRARHRSPPYTRPT